MRRCGQLTATCTGEPVRISACHCLDYQRRSGSAFAVQARFADRDFPALQYSVWEGRKHDWVAITGDGMAHHD